MLMKSDIFMDKVDELSERVYNAQMKNVEEARQYIKDITALIYDYKMTGMIYDFYADDVEIFKQDCRKFTSSDEFFKDVITFEAAFPDLIADIENVIINKAGDDCYKVYRRLRFRGTNTGLSKYGTATGKILGDNCLNLTVMYLKKINGKWKITMAIDSDSEDCIRQIQTADA